MQAILCEGVRYGDLAASHRPDVVEQAMVEFVRRWYRYGGGPASHIFVDFGLKERDFFARTLALLATDYAASRIGPTTLRSLRDVCRWRIESTRQPTSRNHRRLNDRSVL